MMMLGDGVPGTCVGGRLVVIESVLFRPFALPRQPQLVRGKQSGLRRQKWSADHSNRLSDVRLYGYIVTEAGLSMALCQQLIQGFKMHYRSIHRHKSSRKATHTCHHAHESHHGTGCHPLNTPCHLPGVTLFLNGRIPHSNECEHDELQDHRSIWSHEANHGSSYSLPSRSEDHSPPG